VAKLPSKEEQKAIRDRIWAAFSVSLPGSFTPTPNEILDARIRNESLPLELRFDALIERKSLGNWSLFACERDWRTGKAVALNQGDCAKILKVDKRRISEIVVIRQAQGFLQPKEGLENPSLLVLVLDPQAPAAIPEKEEKPKVVWATFSKHWDEAHPAEIERRALLLSQAAPFLEEAKEIHLQKLAAFKKAKEEEVSAEGPDVPDTTSPDVSGTSPKRPDTLSDTSGRISPPEPHGHGIGPRARPTNLKQFTSSPPATTTNIEVPGPLPIDLVVVAEKLRAYGAITNAAVAKFVAACRKECPDSRTADVVAAIGAMKIRKSADNPMGVLLTQVPAIVAVQHEQRVQEEKKSQQAERESAEWDALRRKRQVAEARSNWNALSAEDKAQYIELYPELAKEGENDA